MFQYKSKPNTNVSIAGRLVRFGPNGMALINKEEVAKWLDALSYVEKVLPKKVKAKAKAKEVKVEVEVKEVSKPKNK